MNTTPHFPIYMDYGATTTVDQRVVDAMIPWLREHFGNPASRRHPWGWGAGEGGAQARAGARAPPPPPPARRTAWGWEAEEAVEKARAEVAALINADPREIVWTSGAT